VVATTYDVVLPSRTESQRTREYVAAEPLSPGDVIVAGDRHWLIDRIEPGAENGLDRAYAVQARYRFRLRHPDGREELGAFRRFRPGGPGLGHAFTIFDDGQPTIWSVVEQRLAHDEQGRPYVDLIAERDHGEATEPPPDHELEHALATEDWSLSDTATATLARAAEAGLSVELVALEPGDVADWDKAEQYIDTLILEEIGDDLLELCDADRAPRWQMLTIVQDRLRADLERFRADADGGHDQIEEWDFRGGRILAAVGNIDDESDPDSAYGWLCRLVDGGVITAAGLHRVRKTELV
jgi:hypothetical protein